MIKLKSQTPAPASPARIQTTAATAGVGVTGSRKSLGADQRVQLWCLWTGPAFAVLFGVGFALLARFVPPPAPGQTAAQLQEVFRSHTDGIRAAAVVMMLGMPFLATWGCAIAAQSARTERGFPILTCLQLIAIGIGTLIAALIPLFWAVAAFRPDAISADITQTLFDVGFFLVLFPWNVIALWVVPLAIAILRDSSETPVFPRWSAYLNLWVAFLSVPGGLIVFFKHGPLAYDGFLAFYVPLAVFFVWVVTMTAVTHKAIKQQPPIVGAAATG